MTQEEILQYNKRCAEFLDIVTEEPHWVEFNKFMPNSIAMSYGRRHHIEQLQFHSDWNWIMEVILAINMIPNPKNPSDATLQTKRTAVQSILRSANKEAVVKAINQFLIWYEQNK